MNQRDDAVSMLSLRGASGPEFFELACHALAKGSGCRWSAVVERCQDDRSARFLARWTDGQKAQTSSYDLTGTPCQIVYEVDPDDPHWLFLDGLAEAFPDDAALTNIGARSYRGELFYGNDGRPAGHVFIMHDKAMIDDERDRLFFRLLAQRVGAEYNRWTAEQLLNQREARSRDFAKSSADWFWEMDENLRYTFVSPDFFIRYGVAPEDILGRTRREYVGEGQIRRDPDKWRRHFDDLAARQPFRDFVVANEKAGRLTKLTGLPYFDDEGNFRGYRGSSTDVTESSKLEQALAQSQKMEAIGQLTGGIAHDFNNLLQVIGGACGIARTGGAEADDWFDRIEQSVQRGSSLTSQLLAFSRQQEFQPESICLQSAISNIEELLRRALGEDIDLKVSCAEDAPPSHLDVHGLQDALINLCINARSAMPTGGKLSIDVQKKSLETNQYVGGEEFEAGEYIELSVADTGVGMTPEIVAQAFNPFFTTKEVGKGTGLGLSMVYGFARQSAGMAEIESEPGVGTNVKLLLPADQAVTAG